MTDSAVFIPDFSGDEFMFPVFVLACSMKHDFLCSRSVNFRHAFPSAVSSALCALFSAFSIHLARVSSQYLLALFAHASFCLIKYGSFALSASSAQVFVELIIITV